jgi:hypothetical protein
MILYKTPKTRAKGIGTLKQNQLQMQKFQCRNMKQQDKSFPSKARSTTKDLNNCKVEEISNIEL